MQFTGNLSGQGNFQMVRQDAPRIGFHLQVGVQARMAAEEGVRFQDEILRAPQGRFRGGVQGNVVMNAPLGIPRFFRVVPPVGQGVRQVREKHGSAPVEDAGLVEINAVVKLAEAFQVFLPAYAAFQGVGELHLAEGDVVFLPGGEGVCRFLPQDGEVAGVIRQPQVAFNEFGAAGVVAQAVEKADGALRIVEMAEGLRLQPKLHQASGLPAQHVQESAHGVQTGEHALLLRMEPAVGGGERADGQPVCVFIPDAGQDAEEVAGVFKTFRRGPVRLENVFLHPLAVKVPVGKAVEGFHARVVFVQP